MDRAASGLAEAFAEEGGASAEETFEAAFERGAADGGRARTKDLEAALEAGRIREMAMAARKFGLRVSAGHGLTYQNVEAIAATKGVDILFIGPGDLGYRYRHDGTGDPDGSRLEAAFERVAAAAKANGIAWACPTAGAANIRKRREQGCQMIANAGDFMSILNGLNAGIREFEEID